MPALHRHRGGTRGRARARPPCGPCRARAPPPCEPRSGATPPTTLVPPPNGTTASELLRAQLEQRAQLLVRARVEDRVGGARRARPRAGARGRGSPCRRRAAPARRDRRGRARHRRSRAAPRAPRARSRAPRQTYLLERDGWARALGEPDRLAQEARARARAGAGGRAASPHPHQRIVGGRRRLAHASATDPLETVECLLERSRLRRGARAAAEARREAHERAVAGRPDRHLLAQLDRDLGMRRRRARAAARSRPR